MTGYGARGTKGNRAHKGGECVTHVSAGKFLEMTMVLPGPVALPRSACMSAMRPAGSSASFCKRDNGWTNKSVNFARAHSMQCSIRDGVLRIVHIGMAATQGDTHHQSSPAGAPTRTINHRLAPILTQAYCSHTHTQRHKPTFIFWRDTLIRVRLRDERHDRLQRVVRPNWRSRYAS